MEDFQRIGDDLGKAITEGDIDKAIALINQAVALDAEFEVYLQPKGLIPNESPAKMPNLPLPSPIPAQKFSPQAQEIYQKLLEMGVAPPQARSLADSCSNLDEAVEQAFNPE